MAARFLLLHDAVAARLNLAHPAPASAPTGGSPAMSTENAFVETAAAGHPVVFVHTNAKQRLGAPVPARSFHQAARDPGASRAGD